MATVILSSNSRVAVHGRGMGARMDMIMQDEEKNKTDNTHETDNQQLSIRNPNKGLKRNDMKS